MYVTIIKVLLAGFVISLIRRIFGQKGKKSKNPFEEDGRRKVEPLVTDKAARKKVIKQKFSPELVPRDLDAIVIGSGIGGLSAAAILAKSGKKVLVLEQLNKAGGCTHTFKENGVEFDVGIHYIGDMMDQTIAKTYVDQITEGQVQWAPLDNTFDIVMIGQPPNEKRYEIKSGPEKVDSLKEYFPDETEAIDKFIKLVKTVNKSYVYYLSLVRLFPRRVTSILTKLGVFNFMAWSKISQITLYDYLNDLTKNQDLRDVLAYCFGDYGTLPKDTCIGFHAFLWKHFYYTSAYPIGGASEFAMHIIPVIEKAGGKVLVSADVKRVLCRNGRAVGVSVNGAKSSESTNIIAPAIISNAGVHNTFKKLLPQELAQECSIMPILNKIKHAGAGLSVFVVLEGSNEELGLKPQNIWAFTDNDLDKITREFFALPASEVPDKAVPLIFQSFPSAKDPSWESRHPDKSTMAIVTLANYEWFEKWEKEPVKKRSDEYKQLKDVIGENLVQQCLKIFPHLKDKVINVITGSPLTNNHYIASPRGEIYGLDHTCYRFSGEALSELRPDTEIPGLYITGQDTMSCGFAGALFGGLMCASSVLNRIVMKDLASLHSEIKKSS